MLDGSDTGAAAEPYAPLHNFALPAALLDCWRRSLACWRRRMGGDIISRRLHEGLRGWWRIAATGPVS